MIQLVSLQSVISTDLYSISHKENGLDELQFELSVSDPQYADIAEEQRIFETTEKQKYIVKKINAGAKTAQISCQLDLSDWEADIFLDPDHLDRPGFAHEFTAAHMLEFVQSNAAGLTSWRIESNILSDKRRQIEMDGPTPLEVVAQMQKTFGCAVRFDTSELVATILYPEECAISNAYVIDEVNLRAAPSYKAKSTDLYTRLYPVGADGMGIAAVNNGIPYVENLSYTSKVICRLWKDARYTDAASLRDDAQARVDAACRPERSWKLDVIDLHRIDPITWPDMSLELFRVIRLVDRNKGVTTDVQVLEDKVWPYYPERNQITVATITGSTQRAVRRLAKALTDPNSDFWQQILARQR